MTLVLVRGIPGSGKDTIAEMLADVVVSADKYPGLYVDGVYQKHLQKQSHVWCLQETQKFLENPDLVVAVANTFTTRYYLQPYINLGHVMDHYTTVLHVEQTIKPDGTFTENVHNVPLEIIESMKSGWEPYMISLKRGITLKEINDELLYLKRPNGILVDFDSTLILSELFSTNTNEIVINPDLLHVLKLLLKVPVYIVSNQRGIEGNHKTIGELQGQINHVLRILLDEGITISGAYFAPKKNSKECLVWDFDDVCLYSHELDTLSDKPNIGMFTDIYEQHRLSDHFWMIGDAHTNERPSDWEFTKNCRELHPIMTMRYIPVEMLNVVPNVSTPL